MARDTLEVLSQTIRRMTAFKDGDKECALITLSHVQGTIKTALEKVIVTNAQPIEPRLVAEMFFGIAETHAEGLDENEIQRYTIQAYVTGSNEPFTNQSFRIDVDNGVSSLVPSEKGMTHQHMRLVEGMFKICTLQSQALLEAQYRMIDRVMKQNEKLMEESADVMEIGKTFIMEKAADEQTKRMELMKSDRNTKLLTKALDIGPSLINQITGKEVFPQSKADTALIESFAESITEEQASKLIAVLSPEQAGLLFSRFAEVLKKKREAKEKENGITS